MENDMTNSTEEIKIQDIPEAKVFLKHQTVYIDNIEYDIITNYREGLNIEALQDRYTKLLQKYHYIVGDWGHDQLRLKGFYPATNQYQDADNTIDKLEDYLREYCAFGCAYFVIKHTGEPEPYKDDIIKFKPNKRRRKPQQDKSKQQSQMRKEKSNKWNNAKDQKSKTSPKKSNSSFIIKSKKETKIDRQRRKS